MMTLINKHGMINRHVSGMPDKVCKINVYREEPDGHQLLLCEWTPVSLQYYPPNDLPQKGYMGTAKVIQKDWRGIGFHAWKQNNSEFIYYTVIYEKVPT